MKVKIKTDEGGYAWNELLLLKDEVHKEIESYARKNETTKLLQLTDWLRRVLDLEIRHQELQNQAARLISERRQPQNQDYNYSFSDRNKALSDNSNHATVSEFAGGKTRARECRKAYIEREKKHGKKLAHLRSLYYKTEAGLIVGITFSSNKKNTWFLNLQDGQFQEAVLLCEIGGESVQVIHLPKAFLDRYSRQMSRDEKGQVKFFLARRDNRFYIQVPEPVGWVDVMDYVEREQLICPRIQIEEFA